MAPRLDTIPLDILQHIAYLSALGSSANPPIDLLHLLLTNSTIYRSLRLRSNPHLYANIFCSVFDFCRSMDHVTASNIAAEFVCRHRFLRRVRRLDFSIEELTQDLWAAVRMILESNRANQMHLITVNFSAFLIDLSQLIFANYPGTEELDLKTVIVWLLCLSVSQKDISHTPIALRGKFVKWIHPFISPSHEVASFLVPSVCALTRRPETGCRLCSQFGPSQHTSIQRGSIFKHLGRSSGINHR